MTPNDPSQRPLWLGLLRSVARAVVTLTVVGYSILEEIFSPLLRPVVQWLGGLRLFQILGQWIGRLPPYVVLVLLAVPFAIIEPAKVFALYWGASGHVMQGTLLLIAAEILSIVVCERIFHAGYAPLMRIGWFNRLITWLVGLRDLAYAWVRSTGIWQWSKGLVVAVRQWLRGVIASLR